MVKHKKIRPSQELAPHPPRPGKGQESPLHRPVSLSYRYAEVGGTFCLSKSRQEEVIQVMDCLRRLTTLTWQQVLDSGRRGEGKAGLNCTRYPDNSLRRVSRPSELSPDVPIVGVRASAKYRVFGAYLEHVFYILWFDRNHDIVPV